MVLKKTHVYNFFFFGFIFFLFTPYGLSTKATLTQGVTYVKSLIFPPSAMDDNEQKKLDTYNISLKGIANADDINFESLKGKVIFVNHWATWCAPCRAEMPSLQKLYDDYNSKIAFIFLTNDTKEVVDKFYLSKDYNFPTYNLQSTIPQQINTTSLPTTFIIDKNGKVFLEEFGPADWNSNTVRKMLDDLLE